MFIIIILCLLLLLFFTQKSYKFQEGGPKGYKFVTFVTKKLQMATLHIVIHERLLSIIYLQTFEYGCWPHASQSRASKCKIEKVIHLCLLANYEMLSQQEIGIDMHD